MHVLIVSSLRLTEQYGDLAARRVDRRLGSLVQARTQRGLPSLILDVERGLGEYDVAPADAGDARAVRAQLLSLADRVERRGGTLVSALLIGGPAILPFHRVGNPLADPDDAIPTDYLYGVREPGHLLTDWPVGRLPSGDESPESLLRLLAMAAWHHRGVPTATRRTFGYSTASWERASRLVYGALEARGPLLLSPPTSAETLDPQLLAGASTIYCNLHGVRGGPLWYGQGVNRRQLVVALRPQDLDELPLVGATVCSEACYGAYSPDYDLDESLAMRFLTRGAACFVGATTIAYGPAGPPLSEADLLARAFLQAVQQRGISVGEAFQQARRATQDETLRRQGFLDEDDVKTLAQFVLYGDPTIRIRL
jgi:hypothetical protein